MKTNLNLFHLIQLAEFIEMGCQTGKDWTQVFSGVVQHPVDSKLKVFCTHALSLYKYQSAVDVFSSFESQSRDPLEKVFFRILLSSQKSSLHLSTALRSFIQTARRIQKLRGQLSSLMFLPKFQGLLAIAIVLIFVAILPAVSSQMFPTFIQLGRTDLFVGGLLGVTVGFSSLWWMSVRPERRLKSLLSQQFLFFFMATFVRLGMDLQSSWTEAVKISCSGKLQNLLIPPQGVRVKSFKDHLTDIIPQTSAAMARNLVGILWILPTSLGLSDYLQACAESEAERLLFAWEDEIRRLSVMSILPLSLFVFPSALFLLAGPQVLGAFSL